MCVWTTTEHSISAFYRTGVQAQRSKATDNNLESTSATTVDADFPALDIFIRQYPPHFLPLFVYGDGGSKRRVKTNKGLGGRITYRELFPFSSL